MKTRNLHGVNEHCEPLFNAVLPSALVLRQPLKVRKLRMMWGSLTLFQDQLANAARIFPSDGQLRKKILTAGTPFFRAHASMVECVVIGAGLAGLQAARRLKDCGVSGKLT
mgnify:CR=1 FL=1